MRWIIIILIMLTGCADRTQGRLHPYYEKPEHAHPFYNMDISNFAKEIDKSSDMDKIVPGWTNILRKQEIKEGNNVPSYANLLLINSRVNNKQSFKESSWMTPKEFYAAKYADCKAYTTTKYYELRALGWKPEDLNIWSGDYKGRAHLLLTARVNNKVYVLDIMDQSLPEAKNYFYKDFVPSYRFNEVGLDIH